jgi:hypothetical protein
MKKITLTSPEECRAFAGTGLIESLELYKSESAGHKFKPGEIRTLHGLVDFPEFNGDAVEITAIREDGPNGKAYYVKGRINEFVNWVYEYRL